jgi:plasmid stability protein
MRKTLTIRLDENQERALRQRAKAQGKSKSEVVRELIDAGLEQRPLRGRIGHLKGRLNLSAPGSEWKRQIRERNWR